MLAVVLALLLSPLAGGLPLASADPSPSTGTSSRESVAALGTAGRVLAGDARASDPSATLALRDLWMARPNLTGTDALEATSLLARPTDGAADPFDNGYTVPATSQCGAQVCVHSVQSTADVSSPEWVALTLSTMESVYDREVRQLGYRAPRSDGVDGGDDRLDVYLKDLGAGLYGYCAAERRKSARTASGFCVLDNDYSPSQFPGATSPQDNLAVTAAHEFFHAVQYSYDYAEDPWMLESTATWMEEQVADDVNDNRQYLRYSQLQAPYVPLDAFSATYGFQYGNWIFWEYLTQRFGTGLVKEAWESAGTLRKDGRRNSVEAVASVLRRKKQRFTEVYADFAAANTTPASTYAEAPGVPEFANPRVLADVTLSRSDKRHRQRQRLDHLAAGALHVRPDAGLSGRRWKVRVDVRGPRRSSSPAARLVVHKVDGTISTRRVRFTTRGTARAMAPFSASRVTAVTVSFANVSTRFRCRQGTDFVCRGIALDDNERFTILARAIKKKRRG